MIGKYRKVRHKPLRGFAPVGSMRLRYYVEHRHARLRQRDVAIHAWRLGCSFRRSASDAHATAMQEVKRLA